jgi:hypothetical protein
MLCKTTIKLSFIFTKQSGYMKLEPNLLHVGESTENILRVSAYSLNLKNNGENNQTSNLLENWIENE